VGDIGRTHFIHLHNNLTVLNYVYTTNMKIKHTNPFLIIVLLVIYLAAHHIKWFEYVFVISALLYGLTLPAIFPIVIKTLFYFKKVMFFTLKMLPLILLCTVIVAFVGAIGLTAFLLLLILITILNK